MIFTEAVRPMRKKGTSPLVRTADFIVPAAPPPEEASPLQRGVHALVNREPAIPYTQIDTWNVDTTDIPTAPSRRARRRVERAGITATWAVGAGLVLGAAMQGSKHEDPSIQDTGTRPGIILQAGDTGRPTLSDGILTLQAPVHLAAQEAPMQQPEVNEDFVVKDVNRPSESTAGAVAKDILVDAGITESTYEGSQTVVAGFIITANPNVDFTGANGRFAGDVPTLVVPDSDAVIALNNASNGVNVTGEVKAEADAVESFQGHYEDIATQGQQQVGQLATDLGITLPGQETPTTNEPTPAQTPTPEPTPTPTPTPPLATAPTATETTTTVEVKELDTSVFYTQYDTFPNQTVGQTAAVNYQDAYVPDKAINNEIQQVLSAVIGAENNITDPYYRLDTHGEKYIGLTPAGARFFEAVSNGAASYTDPDPNIGTILIKPEWVADANLIEQALTLEAGVTEARKPFFNELLTVQQTPATSDAPSSSDTAPIPSEPPSGTPVPENSPPVIPQPAPPVQPSEQHGPTPEPIPPGADHTYEYSFNQGDTVSELVRDGMIRAGIAQPTHDQIYVGVTAIGAVNPNHEDLDLVGTNTSQTLYMIDDASLGKIADAVAGKTNTGTPVAPDLAAAANDVEDALHTNRVDSYDTELAQGKAAVLITKLGITIPDQNALAPAVPSGIVVIDRIPQPVMTDQVFDQTAANLQTAGMVDPENLTADNLWDQTLEVPGTTYGIANQFSRSDMQLSHISHLESHAMQEDAPFLQFDREMVEPMLKGVNKLTLGDMLYLKKALPADVYSSVYELWAVNNMPKGTEADIATRDRVFTERVMIMLSYVNNNSLEGKLKDLTDQLSGMTKEQIADFIAQNPDIKQILTATPLIPNPPLSPGGPGLPGGSGSDQTYRNITVHVDLPYVPNGDDPTRLITVNELNHPELLTPVVDSYGDKEVEGAKTLNQAIDPNLADEDARIRLQGAINDQIEPDITIPPVIIRPSDIPAETDETIVPAGYVAGGVVLLALTPAVVYALNRRRKRNTTPRRPVTGEPPTPLVELDDTVGYVPPDTILDAEGLKREGNRLMVNDLTPDEEKLPKNISPLTGQPMNHFSTRRKSDLLSMLEFLHAGVTDNAARAQKIDEGMDNVEQTNVAADHSPVYDVIHRKGEGYITRRRDIPHKIKTGPIPPTT